MTQVVTDMVSGVVPVVAPAPVTDAADRVTDMVTDVVTADGGLLDRQIPRPRGVTTLPLVAPAVLVLGLAVVSVSQGRLELPAAIATALAWPPLLAVSGRYRRQALGQSRGGRLGVVLAAGARTAVLTLAISPLVWHADPLALAALVAGFTVASGLPFVAGVRRPLPRVVLAGRPRDVREAVAHLRASGTHEVVAACLTRASKTPVEGDVPVYVGLQASSTAAHDHGADALVVLPGAKLSPVEVRRLHWSLSGLGTELYLGTGLLDVA